MRAFLPLILGSLAACHTPSPTQRSPLSAEANVISSEVRRIASVIETVEWQDLNAKDKPTETLHTLFAPVETTQQEAEWCHSQLEGTFGRMTYRNSFIIQSNDSACTLNISRHPPFPNKYESSFYTLSLSEDPREVSLHHTELMNRGLFAHTKEKLICEKAKPKNGSLQLSCTLEQKEWYLLLRRDTTKLQKFTVTWPEAELSSWTETCRKVEDQLIREFDPCNDSQTKLKDTWKKE